MNWKCRLFGHNWKYSRVSGIRADGMRVNRTVKYCKRCPERIQTDSEIGEVDPKIGYYSWGSAGPCYGCANKENCPEVPYKKGMYGGAFAWARCPINNFEIAKGFEHYLTGDTIVAK